MKSSGAAQEGMKHGGEKPEVAVGYLLLRRTGQCPGRACPHGAASGWEEEKEEGDSVCVQVWGVCRGVWECAESQTGPACPPPDAQDESTKGMLTMQRAPQRKLLSGASNGALQGRGQGPTGFSDSQAENGL